MFENNDDLINDIVELSITIAIKSRPDNTTESDMYCAHCWGVWLTHTSGLAVKMATAKESTDSVIMFREYMKKMTDGIQMHEIIEMCNATIESMVWGLRLTEKRSIYGVPYRPECN